MPSALDHVLFVILATFFPIWTVSYGSSRLKRAAPGRLSQVRLSVYRVAITVLWTLTVATLALWIAKARRFGDLGLAFHLTPGLIGVVGGFAIIIVLVLRQRADAFADDEAVAKIRNRLRRLELMLPHTREELGVFYLLSVTAGVCEELLYRGYLMWYLSHWLGYVPTIAVAAALFGIGHTYQGWRGILTTTAVGAFFGVIYLLTRSIFAPMLIHALMDIHSGHLAFVAFSREPTRDAGVPDDEAAYAAEWDDGPPHDDSAESGEAIPSTQATESGIAVSPERRGGEDIDRTHGPIV